MSPSPAFPGSIFPLPGEIAIYEPHGARRQLATPNEVKDQIVNTDLLVLLVGNAQRASLMPEEQQNNGLAAACGVQHGGRNMRGKELGGPVPFEFPHPPNAFPPKLEREDERATVFQDRVHPTQSEMLAIEQCQPRQPVMPEITVARLVRDGADHVGAVTVLRQGRIS